MNYVTAIEGWVIAIAVLILALAAASDCMTIPRRSAGVLKTLHLLRPALPSNRHGDPGRNRHRRHGLALGRLRIVDPLPVAPRHRPHPGIEPPKDHGNKGGLGGIDALVEHIAGGSPGYLAVDGPAAREITFTRASRSSRSEPAPRSSISRGPLAPLDLHPASIRFQIPKPFSTIHGYFGEPIFPQKDESVEQFRKRIEPP